MERASREELCPEDANRPRGGDGGPAGDMQAPSSQGNLELGVAICLSVPLNRGRFAVLAGSPLPRGEGDEPQGLLGCVSSLCNAALRLSVTFP